MPSYLFVFALLLTAPITDRADYPLCLSFALYVDCFVLEFVVAGRRLFAVVSAPCAHSMTSHVGLFPYMHRSLPDIVRLPALVRLQSAVEPLE
jgi:hypothetical protein